MCSFLLAAAALAAGGAFLENDANQKKLSAEAGVVNAETKRQQNYSDQNQHSIDQSLADNTIGARDKRTKLGTDQAVQQSEQATARAVALFDGANGGKSGGSAAGQISSKAARSVRSRSQPGLRTAGLEQGLFNGGLRELNRAGDRENIAANAERSMGVVPTELAAAGTTGQGEYTLGRLMGSASGVTSAFGATGWGGNSAPANDGSQPFEYSTDPKTGRITWKATK